MRSLVAQPLQVKYERRTEGTRQNKIKLPISPKKGIFLFWPVRPKINQKANTMIAHNFSLIPIVATNCRQCNMEKKSKTRRHNQTRPRYCE